MGGKRPDQHNIDPGEAGSTDYKFLRQDPRIKERERHELAGGDQDEVSKIPGGGRKGPADASKAKEERGPGRGRRGGSGGRRGRHS